MAGLAGGGNGAIGLHDPAKFCGLLEHSTQGAVLVGVKAKLFEVSEDIVCGYGSAMASPMLNRLEGCVLPFRIGIALNPFKSFFFERLRLKQGEMVKGHGTGGWCSQMGITLSLLDRYGNGFLQLFLLAFPEVVSVFPFLQAFGRALTVS